MQRALVINTSSYRFDVHWLKDKRYHSRLNIESDSKLTPKEKRYLKGIHERQGKDLLASYPSMKDIEVLVEAYRSKDCVFFVIATY